MLIVSPVELIPCQSLVAMCLDNSIAVQYFGYSVRVVQAQTLFEWFFEARRSLFIELITREVRFWATAAGLYEQIIQASKRAPRRPSPNNHRPLSFSFPPTHQTKDTSYLLQARVWEDTSYLLKVTKERSWTLYANMLMQHSRAPPTQ